MCFGDKLGETQIKKIEEVERRLLLSSGRFAILNFFPSIERILFRKRWEELFQLRRNQDDVLIPLIKARRKVKQERQSKMKEGKENDDEFVVSYVDTLLDLELPEEKGKLEDKEMVNLCSVFLDAGTDTTSTALEWIMANLVKYPQIQERLLVEIKGVVEMGWDSRVWEDPMEFKPERFLSGDDGGEAFDITGNREIRMMPFGAGRRICPASEKHEFTMVMKNPLKAHLSPRTLEPAVGNDVGDCLNPPPVPRHKPFPQTAPIVRLSRTDTCPISPYPEWLGVVVKAEEHGSVRCRVFNGSFPFVLGRHTVQRPFLYQHRYFRFSPKLFLYHSSPFSQEGLGDAEDRIVLGCAPG
uniref:Cytochrome P450 n=1 Tax=Quercus lobata TaxID=97700 RepID=A0A7N2MJL0_QUELO